MKTFSITIHRPTYGEDDYGNPEIVSYTNITSRAFRVDPVRAREISLSRSSGGGSDQGQQTMIVSVVGYFPPDVDIRETDEITANGKRYQMLGVYPIAGTNPLVNKLIYADLQAIS